MVSGQLELWTKLAGDDANMRQTLERLHGLFANAPDLGSLINPTEVPIRERMFTPDFGKVAPLLEGALSKERADDPVAAVFGSAALGVVRAAELLVRQVHSGGDECPLSRTRGKQGSVLRDFIELSHGGSEGRLGHGIRRTMSVVLPAERIICCGHAAELAVLGIIPRNFDGRCFENRRGT